jgi:hypothetical protein
MKEHGFPEWADRDPFILKIRALRPTPDRFFGNLSGVGRKAACFTSCGRAAPQRTRGGQKAENTLRGQETKH